MASARGVVQDLGYTATFPLLLNIAGEPTYFIPLQDQGLLVKMYAMVNVAQYNVVATGTTVSECERAYMERLRNEGITQEDDLPQTEVSGTVAEIRSAVLEGNTYYFIRLEDEEVFYALSAAENPVAVILNVGDQVTIEHAVSQEDASILSGYSLTVVGRAEPQMEMPPAQTQEPAAPAGEETAQPAA